MVRVFQLIIVIIYSFNSGVQATEIKDAPYLISFFSNKKDVTYGKTFNLSFKMPFDKNFKLNEFLKPLNTLIDYSIVNENISGEFITYKIKCKPLIKKGELRFPTLQYQRYKTHKFSITVNPAKSAVGIDININLVVSNHSLWEREQSTLLINVITTDKDIILDTKKIIHPGLESYSVRQFTNTKKVNNNVYYHHTIGWNLFFLYRQQLYLEIPEVVYMKNGVPRYKFNFKDVSYDIKSLPVYVSPTTPVGEIQLSATYKDISLVFMQPNNSSILDYQLKGYGIPAKWLPSIAHKYNAIQNKKIQFSHIQTKLNNTHKDNSLVGSKKVTISFTPGTNGLLPINDLSFKYFDPGDGKLKNYRFIHNKKLVLHLIFQLIILVILVALFFVFIRWVLNVLTNQYRHYRYLELLRKNLEKSTSLIEIKQALKYFSLLEGWHINKSITNWLMHFSRKYKVSDSLTELFNEFNLKLYSTQPVATDDIMKIKTRLLDEIKQRQKKPRKINLTFLSQF